MNAKQSKLFEAHCAEAESKNAEFFNLGLETDDTFIVSKTDQGRLYSEIDEKGKITHEWEV